MIDKCLACNSPRIEPGHLTGLHNLDFVPQHAKGLAETSKVDVQVVVCANCGYMMIHADTEQLNAKADIPVPDSSAKPAADK